MSSERDVSAAFAAALQDRVVRPILLYDADFTDGHFRAWTGIGPLSWDGNTYFGVGDLVGISPMEETDEIKAGGITVTLAGVTEAAIAQALQILRLSRNRSGVVYLGLLDETGQVIEDPWPLFIGRLDTGEIEDGEKEARINVVYEHENIDLERPNDARWTNEEQQRRFPGDTGMRFIIGMQDKVLRWGTRDEGRA